jgi:hypothetical protein
MRLLRRTEAGAPRAAVAYPPQLRTKRPIWRRTRPKDTLRHNPTLTGTIFRRGPQEGLPDAWSDE